MGSRSGTNTDEIITMPTRKTRRRRANNRHRKAVVNGGCSSVVSDKLEALKSLIPAQNKGDVDVINADRLFQQTADYILLLRTQVSILQELVDFYGSTSSNNNKNAVQ